MDQWTTEEMKGLKALLRRERERPSNRSVSLHPQTHQRNVDPREGIREHN